MAAIDFPSSPANGQLFSPANGVTYQWQATPGIWTVMSPRGSMSGDFCASMAAGPAIPTTAATVVFTSIVSGNSGGWYNTTTGRFTPPAGRYALLCVLGFISSPANTCTMTLRKNGANIASEMVSNAAAGYSAQIAVALTVDANGTDYFDIILNAAVGGGTANGLSTFSAFPIAPPLATYNSVPTAPGDFCVGGTPFLNTSIATLVPTTIISGNLGGIYNTSNGRFTPPAGRYKVSATFSAYSAAAAADMVIALRKNGTTDIAMGRDTSSAINLSAQPFVDAIVDANGTDFFEIRGSSSAGSQAIYWMTISVSPLQPALIPYPQAITTEFQVTHAANFALPTSPTVINWNTVIVNPGNYWNPATSRYTPPAGRYRLFGMLFGLTTAGAYMSMQFTKNGVGLSPSNNVNSAAGVWANMSDEVIVDANGTDYFQMIASNGTSTGSQHNGMFGATPVGPVAASTATRIVVSPTAPTTPALNDLWVDTT